MTPAIRAAFGLACAISPKLGGLLALRLFSTPLKTKRLSPAEARLEVRAKDRLARAQRLVIRSNGSDVIAYRFGQKRRTGGETIVLVHGWMSGARYMLAMVDPLVTLGHEVICFDLPAHGESVGKVTNLVACAQALIDLIDHIGGANRIIAHSFGGAVTAYALSKVRPGQLGERGRITLIASPNQLRVVTERFGTAIGLTPAALKIYQDALCAPLGAPLEAMDGNIMFAAAGYPIDIIHSIDDPEVSIEEARRYTQMGSKARLTELNGLGHRQILYKPTAIAAIVDSIRRD
jgi:pimeloyl-ACP methyl ester carboxylesterase